MLSCSSCGHRWCSGHLVWRTDNVCKNTGSSCGQGGCRCVYEALSLLFYYVLVISALHSCCFTVNFNICQGDIQGEHWVKCSLGQRSPTRLSPWALWAPAQQEAVGILSWHLDVGFLVALWDCHGWGRAISFSILFPSTLGDPMTLFWKVNKVFLEPLSTQTGLGRSAAGGSEMDW